LVKSARVEPLLLPPLEQVGEAGAVLRLEPHADVVHHADADGGRAVVFRDDDGQAVVELHSLDRQDPLVGARGERGQRQGKSRQQGGDGAFAHSDLKVAMDQESGAVIGRASAVERHILAQLL
jgi:hypothetical protein